MPGREKTSQQGMAYYSLKTNQKFVNRRQLHSFFFILLLLFAFVLSSPLEAPPLHPSWPFLFYFFLFYCIIFIFPASELVWVHLALIFVSQAAIFCVFTAPLKWWKSILRRDQDLYDKQSPQLEAHQTHLNARQKKRFLPSLCLLLKSR